MALDIVASGRWSVGAVVVFSGLLAPTPISPQNNKTPVIPVHGTDDRTIPSDASAVAAGQLRAAGFSVELEIEPRVGHTIFLNEADSFLGMLSISSVRFLVKKRSILWNDQTKMWILAIFIRSPFAECIEARSDKFLG